MFYVGLCLTSLITSCRCNHGHLQVFSLDCGISIVFQMVHFISIEIGLFDSRSGVPHGYILQNTINNC
jgi:hypothetical protein